MSNLKKSKKPKPNKNKMIMKSKTLISTAKEKIITTTIITMKKNKPPIMKKPLKLMNLNLILEVKIMESKKRVAIPEA